MTDERRGPIAMHEDPGRGRFDLEYFHRRNDATAGALR